jgi:hypothetical protein
MSFGTPNWTVSFPNLSVNGKVPDIQITVTALGS